MKTIPLTLLLLTAGLPAQIRQPRIPQADQEVIDRQAGQIFKTLRAVNFEAGKVTFPLYSGRQRVAYGVSLGEERLLTKASEVLQRPRLFTSDGDGQSLSAKLVGVYPDHDLAIVKVPGLKAPVAQWTDAGDLSEGTFLAAIRADGEAQAMGVLSVRERSLKSEDQGFLGIQMDPREVGEGVPVIEVVPDSAAAEVGIQAGDVITQIEGKEINGFYELSTRLRRLRAGETPEIKLVRAGNALTVKPTLKGREIPPGVSRRLQRMDQMSGTQSRVRGNFASVIQSDMELEAQDAGLPVVDLQGRIIGLVIARAGRISTLILPGDEITGLLKSEPQAVEEAPALARGGQEPANRRERVQRELEMMRRTMERLQQELDRE